MGWYQRQKKLYETRQQDNEPELPQDEQIRSEQKKEMEIDMEDNRDMEATIKPQDTVSLIGEHTELTGDISTDDDLTIYGRVKGNIKCSRSIQIYGSVEGDILCQDAVVTKASIHGNIECRETLKISEESDIEGNITTSALENGGSIRGDIHASGHICLSAQSVVSGDINAGTISVEQGACIQGCVMIGVSEKSSTQSETKE